jgi:hypothetical protein
MDRNGLYNLAIQCARLNDAGCALGCEHCQFNVFNYGLPITEASLLKANAYTDFYNQKAVVQEAKEQVNIESIVRWVGIIVVCIVFLWTCSSIKSCGSPPGDTIPQELIPSNNPELVWLRDNPNRLSNIPIVFQLMEQYGVPDVNGDGKIDCIDYSVWFRLLYGSDARLIINRNPNNGMNHMFVRIWYNNDQILDLEPQGDAQRYMMSLIWGMRYDPRFNRDVTSSWGNVR